MIKIIMAAVARNRVIGKDNQLVWHLPADLKFFKQTTLGHTLIMGRKTLESLSNPLPKRDTWVVTTNRDYQCAGVTIFHSLDFALEAAQQKGLDKVFILGGGEIYRQAIKLADKLIITEVHADFEGDTLFPVIDQQIWQETKREDHPADDKNLYSYSFVEYETK